MRFKTAILILFFFNAGNAQSPIDSLDIDLEKIASQKIIPGFATLIIKDDKLMYSRGFGFANVEKELPYTDHTIQNIASISKTFIGVSLMKAQSLGLLNLDDPINQYLDYEIVNPKYPNEVISIRHIASHTSSLHDPEDYEKAYIFEGKIELDVDSVPKGFKKYIELYNSNQRVGLDEFIKSVYVPGGKYYSKKNFLRRKAGLKYAYSNIGAGIAARIIENASGMSFEAFTQKYIFDPLEMTSSSWRLSDINLERKSLNYLTYNTPLPHYSLITFADGGLITSVHDLGLYIHEMMKCYNGTGTILSEMEAKEMMTPYLKKSKEPYGVFWETSASGESLGHNGGDPGSVTFMYFTPKEGIAKILFANIVPLNDEVGKSIRDVWNTLKKYQSRI